MEKRCHGCAKTIGMFSGENYILPNSKCCLCDKCYSSLRIPINKMKALENMQGLYSAYKGALESVRQSSIMYTSPIVEEIEQLYLKRQAELSIAQEEMEQAAKRLAEENKKEEEEKERERQLTTYIDEHYNEISKHFLMSTGNDFSGYEIIDYLGIVSGGVVQGTGWLAEFSVDINDLFG